jgi:hypothetical protein
MNAHLTFWSCVSSLLCAAPTARFVGRARTRDAAPRSPTIDPEARDFYTQLLDLKPNGHAQRTARCPFHTDNRASLSVNLDTGLWTCHAQCGSGNRAQFEARMNEVAVPVPTVSVSEPKVQVAVRRTAEAVYEYCNDSGAVVFRKLRCSGKRFFTERPDGNGGWIKNLDGIIERPLYNLPAVLAAPNIAFCEGEKDADRLNLLFAEQSMSDWAATTNFDGAGKPWRADYGRWMAKKNIVFLPDNDDAGRQHVETFAAGASAVAASVAVLPLPDLPEKGDVSDYLDIHSDKKFLSLLRRAERFLDPRDALFITAAQFSKETPEKVPWVVEGLAAEQAATQLIGKPKIGKSTFTHAMLRAVRAGKPFLDRATAQTPVVYLTEMSETDLRAELKTDGLLDWDDLHILFWHRAMRLPWGEAISAAIAKCRKVGARMLIVDTFSRWARIEHENDAGETLAALLPLEEAVASGLCVWIESHERKSGGELADAGRGSGALSGAVSILITLRRPAGGNHPPTYREIQVIGRHGTFSLVLNYSPTDYAAVGTRAAVVHEQAEVKLREVLPKTEKEALTLKELEKCSQVKRGTLQRILATGVSRGLICERGKERSKKDPRRYWAREHHPPVSTVSKAKYY